MRINKRGTRRGKKGISWKQEGMRMHVRYCAVRQLTGILLVLVGVLLVFLCLPMQFFLIVFGVSLAVAGFLLLR